MTSTPAPRGLRAWVILLGASALCVTLLEILLLWLGGGYLTSGYNTTSLASRAEVTVFCFASLVFDAGLILALWMPLLPIASRLGARPLQIYGLAAVAGVAIPVAVDAARFNLYSIVGDMFDVALMSQVGSATWSAMAVEVIAETRIYWLIAALVATFLVAAVIIVLGRVDRRQSSSFSALQRPSTRQLMGGLVLATCLGTPFLMLSGPAMLRLRFGLERKPSSLLMGALLHRIADVDGDGFDAFTQPPDNAPWDAAIHPYALDWPGNGVDENGLGGDLRTVLPIPGEPPPPDPLDVAPPHVLILYLESFRADLLQLELDGRPIAPFLQRLAESGASSEHAWVHSPWTLSSRSQLFSGRLVSKPGESTLIDDFKSWGYTVAYYSGQDESYGDSEEILGTARADIFYDARRDLARRTSRSMAPASLQVSWKTLLERVEQGFDAVDFGRPLFLYVNIVDTHFPYSHEEVDDLLGVSPLSRHEIRSHRARQVFRAYANTAANVDRAAERLVASWRARIGDADHAILVLADHGQSFYEEGTLGHGQSIDAAESQIPFIVWGIGGEWPEPLAPTDVRGLLRRNLAAERGALPPRARFVPDPERRVLQYVPRLSRPRVIALRGLDAVWVYDFERDRFERRGADGVRLEDRPAPFLTLLWSWESLALAAFAAETP